jgi:competence protein ComFC
MKAFKLFIKTLYPGLLNFVFPKFCVNCGREGKYLCRDCELFVCEAELVCPFCQKPSFFGKKHKQCSSFNDLDGLVCFWDYEGIVETTIKKIKSQKIFHVLEEVTEIFLSSINQERLSPFFSFLSDKETYVTFVPLSSNKERKRGFNQSEILAGYLAEMTGKRKIQMIARIKETKPQVDLKKEERFLNVKDAFSFMTIKGQTKIEKVVLVADLWASGATMKECCRLLKMSGVKEVWGFALAKT